jgi:hypothetical protein
MLISKLIPRLQEMSSTPAQRMLRNLEILLVPRVVLHFFHKLRVEFIRRQANAAAHVLAQKTTSLASSNIYYVIPYYIETIIINEML